MIDQTDRKLGESTKRFPEYLGQDDDGPGIGKMVIGENFIVRPPIGSIKNPWAPKPGGN